jgi:tRNA dimethylallyltransferase
MTHRTNEECQPGDTVLRNSSSRSREPTVTDVGMLVCRDPAKPLVLAIVGPTATGKSALGLALAERYAGEIVNCDSTAVFRGFDIGTDKVPLEQRRGIPHHVIDVAEPTDIYTAARYASDAARAIREILARGRLPIVVGGTGFYYRALTRGLFPGPGADEALRARLERLADRRGVSFLHRLVRGVDPDSGERILPRDRKRLVRALEVYFLTGRPLTAHFAQTVSPLAFCEIAPLALRIHAALTSERVTRRVDAQFARGLMAEVRDLLACGVPRTARPFGGLVYRQALELLQGVRDEAATRALIAQENRRYARRQLIWFRKEPNLVWFDGPGEHPAVIERAAGAVAAIVERHG